MAQVISPLGYIEFPAVAPAVMVGDSNAAGAIELKTDLGTSETILITNNKGTDTAAIALAATVGGVSVSAGKNVAGAISLTTNAGTSETVVVTNTQGTAAGAIELKATAGGVKLKPAPAVGLSAPIVSASGTTAVTATSSFSLVTITGLTTAADNTASLVTVTNAAVSTSSLVVLGQCIYAGTGWPVAQVVALSAGSFTMNIRNVHSAAALNASVVVPVLVINHSA